MPSKKEFMQMIEDVSAFAEEYRRTNIDPNHQIADEAYHGILPNLDKYLARNRSALFIPKTRDRVRKWVTGIVNAFYVSDDIVTLSYPENMDKQKFTNEVFNLRLEMNTQFYKFLVAAAHSHVKYGNAIGKTGWEYKDAVRIEYDHSTNENIEIQDPIVDRPFFEVIPFENVQYDYRIISGDPLQESPYLRHFTPVYISDVEFMWNAGWKKPRGLDYSQVLVSSTDSAASVRKARQGEMRDPASDSIGSQSKNAYSFDQVWLVENYFRVGGTDWTFLTLGDEYMITDPVRVVDKFPHGKRPFSMSQFDPEAFRSYSDGLPMMIKDLQAEANAIRNQRRDNVSLVLNARHYVSRKAQINMATLFSSVAGGAIIGQEVGPEFIRREEVTDVTASSYREEEITSRDIEESSGQSENRLGVSSSDRQTATEAAIKASSSGEMEGFIIKGFVETFLRPLLEMFHDNLIAYEEDDEVLLKAAMATGLDPDPDLLVRTEVVINAGMGSTNKELKSMRWEKVIEMMVKSGRGNVDEAFGEWLALVGVKNTRRFLGPGASSLVGGNAGGVGPPPAGAQPPVPNAPGPPGITSESPPGAQEPNEIPNFGGFAGGLAR